VGNWSWKGLRKELATNPEVLILWTLLALATLLDRGEVGALGYCQIWGISLALGGLWAVAFPRYLQEASPGDIVVKSIFLLGVGGMIIFAGWARIAFFRLRYLMLDENRIVIPGWIWAVGWLVGGSGLAGLFLCKRVSLAIRGCSRPLLRLCAILLVLAGILLAVMATEAGNELYRLGANSA